MASKRDVDELADRVAKSLQLDQNGQLLDMEELVYKSSSLELEALRKQVLQKQSLSGFDDEGLVKRFLQATKHKGVENGTKDSQSYFNCFQNQIMLPTVIDDSDQLPEDLHMNWICMACPEGTRVLVIASHKSTRAYDLEGTWICEHDTHLPGGSPSDVSKVEDDSQCTILDCLYNNEQEIYYVVDLLCWKGLRFYKYETSVRTTTLAEKLKALPSLKCISQTNPFRFHSLPASTSCQEKGVCTAITHASFELTGLLFYHKRALYLPGLTPLGLWVETSYIPTVLNIQVHKLEYSGEVIPGKCDWRKNRYEMSPEQVSSVHNSAYATSSQTNQRRGVSNRNVGQRGDHFQQFPHCVPSPFPPAVHSYRRGPWGFECYGDYGDYCTNYQQPEWHFASPRYGYNQALKENKKGNLKPKAEKVLDKDK